MYCCCFLKIYVNKDSQETAATVSVESWDTCIFYQHFVLKYPKHDLSFHTVSFLRLCNFNHLYRSETDLVFQDHIVSQLFLKRLLIKTWSIFPSFSGSQWFSPPKACLIVIQTVAVRSSDGTLCWGTKGGTGWGGRYLLWHLWSSDAICFFFDKTQKTEAWAKNLPYSYKVSTLLYSYYVA